MYNEEDSNYGVTKIDEEISEAELIKFLNSNITEENNWKKWKLGTNGYPTFID